MGVVELIIWLLGEEQQLAMAMVANAFKEWSPKANYGSPRGQLWWGYGVWALWGGLIDGEAFKDLTGWARAADSNYETKQQGGPLISSSFVFN
jgi:hypothetical protein